MYLLLQFIHFHEYCWTRVVIQMFTFTIIIILLLFLVVTKVIFRFSIFLFVLISAIFFPSRYFRIIYFKFSSCKVPKFSHYILFYLILLLLKKFYYSVFFFISIIFFPILKFLWRSFYQTFEWRRVSLFISSGLFRVYSFPQICNKILDLFFLNIYCSFLCYKKNVYILRLKWN